MLVVIDQRQWFGIYQPLINKSKIILEDINILGINLNKVSIFWMIKKMINISQNR